MAKKELLNKVREKAEEKQISLDSMLILDAIWVFENKLAKKD